MAVREKGKLNSRDDEAARETLVELAYAKGYWSIWMTVFENDPNMRKRFIKRFPGTAVECFDESHRPQERPEDTI